MKAPVKAREVAILGYAEESRDLIFNLSEKVEIWGINAAHMFTYASDSDGSLVRKTKAVATNWFQLHPLDWKSVKGDVTGYFGRPKEHMDFLEKFDGTLWLQKEVPELPNGKRYPIEEIIKASGRSYFTSTFAYQAGLLWYQHVVEKNPVKRLYVYGVNLSSIDEYIHQKTCVEYWIGRLEEAGIQVVVPDQSSLLKGKLYAMSTGGDLSDHAFERLQFWKEKYMGTWADLNTTSSMKAEVKFWAGTLSQIAEEHPEQFNDDVKGKIQAAIDQRINAIQNMMDRFGADLNGALGMVKDNQHWLSMTGGIDHRAPQLPEIRLASDAMSQKFEPAEPKSI